MSSPGRPEEDAALSEVEPRRLPLEEGEGNPFAADRTCEQPDRLGGLSWNAPGDVRETGETAETQDDGTEGCPEEDELELWYKKYASELSPQRDRPVPEWDGRMQPSSGGRPERDRDARTERRAGGSRRDSNEARGWASNAVQRGGRRGPETEGRTTRRSTMDQREYEIEDLIAAGVDEAGRILFRVRWKGYGPKDDTWEPESNLPPKMVQAARRRLNLARTSKI